MRIQGAMWKKLCPAMPLEGVVCNTPPDQTKEQDCNSK